MNEIKALVNGAGGRMGQMVIEEIEKNPRISLGAGLEEDSHPKCISNNYLPCSAFFTYLEELKKGIMKAQPLESQCDVVIDFSAREAAINLLQEARLPSVIGVTGFKDDQLDEIREISADVPIVQDYNFSVGICLLTAVAENMARVLGLDFNAEISEIHHGGKKDAPSGTAIKLAKAIAIGREQNYNRVVRMSREGMTGTRPTEEIGIQALRLAGVVGEHTVYFGSSNERIELTHKAGSRAVFAQGAVRAAQWVVNQPPGLYTMKDVLGLN